MNYVEHLSLYGVEAKEIPCIKGNGAPSSSTEGGVGSFYMDISTEEGTLYKCVAKSGSTYTWVPFSSGSGEVVPGEPGEDGVSCTHEWNGTVLTVTSASGTSSADLKGEKGDPGPGAEPFVLSIVDDIAYISSNGVTLSLVNDIAYI